MVFLRSTRDRRNPGGFRKLVGAAAMLLFSSMAATALASPIEVEVIRSDGEAIVLEYRVTEFFLEPVDVDGIQYSLVVAGDEAPLTTRGAPQLPSVTRSVMIPSDAEMSAKVIAAEYDDFQGVKIAPSKGTISRQVDPSTVPWEFGPDYQNDALFPESTVAAGAPYLLRDARGLVVNVHPFRFNPARETLRVYSRIVVELTPVGPGETNVLDADARHPSAEFSKIYRHHFVNGDSPPMPDLYPAVTEAGEMLIICNDAWLSNVAPLVAHKNSIGIPTTAVGISTIGNNSSSIASYIQTLYNSSDLTFVLLVGDASQVATPSSSGGSSDPSYAKVSGSDNYPDILVGRFSAETSAHVDTQVARTIAYETNPTTSEAWFKKGIGIGSEEGPGDDGEDDSEHIDNIRTDLLGYGYTQVDQIYDPGASASSVTSALNSGRGIINYCGHGSDTSWGTTGFSNSNVNALTNDNMLPFIFSVACVNGNFSSGTCFGEAWLRATNGSNPTGAIAIYASSINQSWDPPMAAQDESNDLLTEEAHFSFGALAFAGSCLMIDEYGSAGVEMYDTWHVFGDPSVRVYGTATPTNGIMVDPYVGQTFAGDAGGPFSPQSVTYTITNVGDSSVDWEVSVLEDWLETDAASGTLSAGTSTTVDISVSSVASTLVFGKYEGDVEFADLTNSTVATRAMTLDIAEVECVDGDDDGYLPLYCDGEDCDDTDGDINPDADEICDDDVDNNCDGLTDEEDPDCEEDTGSDSDADSDTDGDTYFTPGDSGCGCNLAASSHSSLLTTLLASLL